LQAKFENEENENSQDGFKSIGRIKLVSWIGFFTKEVCSISTGWIKELIFIQTECCRKGMHHFV